MKPDKTILLLRAHPYAAVLLEICLCFCFIYFLHSLLLFF